MFKCYQVELPVENQSTWICRMPRFNQAKRVSKNHSRVMPFLIPPSEFKPGELTQLGLTGTCELQICRSAGPWSLGTSDRVEHSIQNAHLNGMYAAPRISSKTPNPV